MVLLWKWMDSEHIGKCMSLISHLIGKMPKDYTIYKLLQVPSFQKVEVVFTVSVINLQV